MSYTLVIIKAFRDIWFLIPNEELEPEIKIELTCLNGVSTNKYAKFTEDEKNCLKKLLNKLNSDNYVRYRLGVERSDYCVLNSNVTDIYSLWEF